MDINAAFFGQFVIGYGIFSLLLSILSYHLLKNTRTEPKKDAVIILLLTVFPPFPLIVLVVMYLKPNKLLN